MIRAVLLAALLAGPTVAASPAWIGRYVYEQSLGRDLSGTTTPFVTHKLVLGAQSCLLTVEGFQAFERIRCTTVPAEGGVEVRFLRYEDRKGANPRKHAYRDGEPLFVLGRDVGVLTTAWKGYAAAPQGAGSGRYFERR